MILTKNKSLVASDAATGILFRRSEYEIDYDFLVRLLKPYGG